MWHFLGGGQLLLGTKICSVKQKFGTKCWGSNKKLGSKMCWVKNVGKSNILRVNFVGGCQNTECLCYGKTRTPFGVRDIDNGKMSFKDTFKSPLNQWNWSHTTVALSYSLVKRGTLKSILIMLYILNLNIKILLWCSNLKFRFLNKVCFRIICFRRFMCQDSIVFNKISLDF